ncbi:Fur family transcriptional regulator [Notoacmeibacter ruber]|uniref:Ferric uptake regulation protein n=1 Tax=Notoacmeibacter ruber TaxID=2670375 RepID=A0A3L7JJJ2_9HYPH|nr:Fur family transcriptional regulator [Notoacmeibacter ruber]RLQ88652.1 transcriptional repressor [Notoacmeibacter ruber]
MTTAEAEILDELESELRAEGVRITRQRMAILAALAGSTDHPTAEELLARSRERDPSVSLATVYRTLSVLVESGTVLRNDFEGAGARFELANKPHHDHLIDLDTGDVIEFTSRRIEKLQEEIAEELGYDIVFHRLELYGRAKKKV